MGTPPLPVPYSCPPLSGHIFGHVHIGDRHGGDGVQRVHHGEGNGEFLFQGAFSAHGCHPFLVRGFYQIFTVYHIGHVTQGTNVTYYPCVNGRKDTLRFTAQQAMDALKKSVVNSYRGFESTFSARKLKPCGVFRKAFPCEKLEQNGVLVSYSSANHFPSPRRSWAYASMSAL